MKKSRLIILVVVVALVLVGGAYAAWTSSTTISVNASAGEMDVEISSTEVGEVSSYVEFSKKSIVVSEDKKAATVSIANLYPGAEANASFIITNTGTIPVMLDSAVHERISAVNTETNQSLTGNAVNMLDVKYTVTAETKSGVVRKTDSSLSKEASLFKNSDIVIEPGQTLKFDMQVSLNEKAGDDTENALFTFRFIPMFVQPK